MENVVSNKSLLQMASKNTDKLICPVCQKSKASLVFQFHNDFDHPLFQVLKQWQNDWATQKGVCNLCLNNAHELLLRQVVETDDLSREALILPTPLRLNTNPDLEGNGVTICLIDSGFYIHPDLEFPENRIKKIVDITNPYRSEDYFRESHGNAWHGTMTSVVCAGSGHLSSGLYRGIASKAELVLLKVTDDEGRITGENIARALHWVVNHYEEYDIRIVNLSVTDDEPVSFKESEISKAIKELYELGVVVVTAAGNDPNAPVLPPASTPEALAIGGLDDRNTLDPVQYALYHSTFGWTVDGLLKPELIAPAIWLAAPILPGTDAHRQASELFNEFEKADRLEQKDQITNEIKNRKLLSPHYQHADGTSFAAPIVCSVIAQMLEANPNLSPQLIREILLTTARPLQYEDRRRQGYGVMQPAHAVMKAKGEDHPNWIKTSPLVDYANQQIRFQFHDHDAQRVHVVGSFNNWSTSDLMMVQRQEEKGVWTLEIPLLSEGHYLYKFLVDDERWVSDPINVYREPDGYNGFNSWFIVGAYYHK